MTNLNWRCFLACLLISNLAISQTMHDFDSLYSSNTLFKSFVDFSSKNYDLYGPDKPLSFDIEGNFKELVREKSRENEYQDVTVRHMLNDTIMITRKVRAKARGNFRRETCKYPPVRLNFKKTEAVIPQFEELDKMKMVVRCQEQERYEQLLMVEYLTYKLLNLFTDVSFRSRLIQLNITDTEGKYKGGEALAFVIETYEDIEARLNGEIIKRENVHPNLTDYHYANLIAVFQYMIGNTDWSIPGLHNVKIMNLEGKDRPFAVPYDFDYSGLVNAPYAVPSELLPINAVTDRLFRGTCRSPEDFEEVFVMFREKRAEIFNTIDEFPYVTEPTRKWVVKYLTGFFEVIDDPKSIRREILDTCLK